MLICKDCKEDKKSIASYWTFNLNTETYAESNFKFDFQLIAEKLKKNHINLKASAAAINPLTKELFIISSVNKLLVITDRQGTLKNFYELDPDIYKQPEGIAFTTNGDLLISNESAKKGSADIMVINYGVKTK